MKDVVCGNFDRVNSRSGHQGAMNKAALFITDARCLLHTTVKKMSLLKRSLVCLDF